MARDLKRGRFSSVIKAKLVLFLSRDMLFNNPPRYNAKMYRMGTRCEKVSYTDEHLRYLNDMEDKGEQRFTADGKPIRAVAIKLDKKIRYVWRDEVMTEREYHEKSKLDIERISLLRKKQNGNVGSSED